MNKILRFSFVALLTLISSMSFAQTTVTFTAGTDNGSLSDDKKAGADQVTKDGISISTSKGLFAAVNGSSKVGEYRVYKSSTFTVTSTVGNITKVVVTCTANGTAKQGPGNFTDATAGDYTSESDGPTGTWTGNAATFSLTASSNQVRMTKVEVTYTPNGNTPVTVTAPTISGETSFTERATVTITVPDGTTVYYTTDGTEPTTASNKYADPFTLTETTTVKAAAFDKDGNKSQTVSQEFKKQTAVTGKGTFDDPYTVAEVLALETLPSDEVYIKGTVVSSVTGTSYKNANYYISDDGTTTGQLEVFRGKYLNGGDFTSDLMLKAGNVVVIKGKLTTYKDEKEVSAGSSIITIDGKTDPIKAGEIQPTDKGGELNPYSPAEVVALSTKDIPAAEVYVQGTVVADATGTSYKNADYYISVDGTETNQLKVFRGKYVDNADFTEDITLKAGTVVLIKGKITSYNNEMEMAQGNYIVKIISTPTNISNIKADTNADSPLYNLAGQRVSKSYKGVVIKNGKKVVVK